MRVCFCMLSQKPTEKCEINKRGFGKAASTASKTHTHTQAVIAGPVLTELWCHPFIAAVTGMRFMLLSIFTDKTGSWAYSFLSCLPPPIFIPSSVIINGHHVWVSSTLPHTKTWVACSVIGDKVMQHFHFRAAEIKVWKWKQNVCVRVCGMGLCKSINVFRKGQKAIMGEGKASGD